MPRTGDRIRFTPSAFVGVPNYGKVLSGMPKKVSAVIEYVNYSHRYFRARFEIFGQPMYECFKF